MTSTPYQPGVEMYPHQYAIVYHLDAQLQARGLTVERVGKREENRLGVSVEGGEQVVVETVPRPSDGDRMWIRADGEWVEAAGAPDVAVRVADMVRRTVREAGRA